MCTSVPTVATAAGFRAVPHQLDSGSPPPRPPGGDGETRRRAGRAVAGAGEEVRCAACDHGLARVADAVTVEGRVEHTRINPGGFVHTFRCFKAAAGVAGQGGASLEHTWFAGYAWQIGLCAGCGRHVGWRFVAPAHRFVGLLSDRIVEG